MLTCTCWFCWPLYVLFVCFLCQSLVDVGLDRPPLPFLSSPRRCMTPPAVGAHCDRCTRSDMRQPVLCDRCRQLRDLVGHTHCNDASHMHGVSPCCHHQCDACTALALRAAGANMYQLSSNYVHRAPPPALASLGTLKFTTFLHIVISLTRDYKFIF